MTPYRILRSPEPGGEGTPPDDQFATIARPELDALREAAAARAEGEARPDEPRARWDRDLDEQRRRAADWERACREAVRDKELALALAGRPLVPGAAAQLVKLWRDEFDAIDDDGRVRVVGRDGRGVAAAVAERLQAAEYAHFCAPASRGGAATGGANRPPAATAATVPRTLGEAVLLAWREAAVARAQGPANPIGLRPRR